MLWIWLSQPMTVHKGVLPSYYGGKKDSWWSDCQYRWCYVLRGSRGVLLTDQQRAIAHSLLSDDSTIDICIDDLDTSRLAKENSFFVLPRQGTISPWSSKASDIFALCGIGDICVERGRYYSCKDHHKRDDLCKVAMDPMMESFVAISEIPKHFQWQEDITSHITSHITNHITSQVHSNDKATEDSKKGWEALSSQLSGDHILALKAHYNTLSRYPYEAEWMMYAQVNSEHCRHGIFKALWRCKDDKHQRESLFSWIQKTTAASPQGILSAYKDNGAVISAEEVDVLICDGAGRYGLKSCEQDIVIKVETHNHPTAVSPYPGAATGVGGEIRDEVATGCGGSSVAGMSGYVVSHLRIPDWIMPWERGGEIGKRGEKDFGYPDHIASSLEIMIQAPLGASRYGNEYGRPQICGFFRTFEYMPPSSSPPHQSDKLFKRGFHKPLMIAGGMGHILRRNVKKGRIGPGDAIVVLGGPAMKVGIGGGSVSSLSSASLEAEDKRADMDFSSVQRDNAEMQRRIFGVIEGCLREERNLIISIHDVGAGGLANAIPEIVHEAGLGAAIDFDAIAIADHTMSPAEVWCNESQERYVLCLAKSDIEAFSQLAAKERAPFRVVGEVIEDKKIRVSTNHKAHDYVNMPLGVLFGNQQRLIETEVSFKELTSVCLYPKQACSFTALSIEERSYEALLERLLKVPAVSDKSFLITIADRSVGGLTYLEPMVGPWQVPVADAGVCLTSFTSLCGDVMAVGERPSLALLDPAASVRIAACEALTNLMCADIESLEDVSFSANWQVDFSYQPDQSGLYRAVHALSQLCMDLGIAVPVGKDSMSMKMSWQSSCSKQMRVSSPISCVITAYAHISNVRNTLTPQWTSLDQKTSLVWIRAASQNRPFCLAGSSLAMAYNSLGEQPPDIDPEVFKRFFSVLADSKKHSKLLAYHDISDGGLITAVLEMAFASKCGVDMVLDGIPCSAYDALFAEEIGCVVQMNTVDVSSFIEDCTAHDLFALAIADLYTTSQVRVYHQNHLLVDTSLMALRDHWSALSHKMQHMRDDAACADEEHQQRLDLDHRGLFSHYSKRAHHQVSVVDKPRVAILREQGINGHREMAFAFLKSDFSVDDITMEQCLQSQRDINDYVGLVACGGFSYGDVLGAGRGWAEVIKHHSELRQSFHRFFHRPHTFALGVCNGAQMLSHLKEFIPQAEHFPRFCQNRSTSFESRTVMVEIMESPSIFWRHMSGYQLPVVVAHGEGRAVLSRDDDLGMAIRYIDSHGHPTQKYPFNPSGSQRAIAGACSLDGRVSMLMPHPERNYLTATHSYKEKRWGPYSPWADMFIHARQWVDKAYKTS